MDKNIIKPFISIIVVSIIFWFVWMLHVKAVIKPTKPYEGNLLLRSLTVVIAYFYIVTFAKGSCSEMQVKTLCKMDDSV